MRGWASLRPGGASRRSLWPGPLSRAAAGQCSWCSGSHQVAGLRALCRCGFDDLDDSLRAPFGFFSTVCSLELYCLLHKK